MFVFVFQVHERLLPAGILTFETSAKRPRVSMPGLEFGEALQRKFRKKHDLTRESWNIWDAPSFRLKSYGGTRINGGEHLASESDADRYRQSSQFVPRIFRQELTLYDYRGDFLERFFFFALNYRSAKLARPDGARKNGAPKVRDRCKIANSGFAHKKKSFQSTSMI